MSRDPKLKTGIQIALLIEIPFILISFLMPITPGKAGSKNGLVEHFISTPSYLDRVFFYWIFTHIIVGLLAIVVLIWWKKTSHGATQNPDVEAE